MRIAGVRLLNGAMAWLHAAELQVAPLDRVTAHLGDRDMEGEVVVSPDQMLGVPARIDGHLSRPRTPSLCDHDCDELPGAELPVLGQVVRWHDLHGLVRALHAMRHEITLACGDDVHEGIPLQDITCD